MILRDLFINYPQEVQQAIEIKVEQNRTDRLEKWSESELARYQKALTAFVEQLKTLIPAVPEEPSIILGSKFRDSWDEEETDEYIAVCIYRIDDLIRYQVDDSIFDIDEKSLSDEEVEKMMKKLYSIPYIESYGYEFEPWEEWLGLEVDLASMKYFGLPECIADILSEMTFNGMDRESQEERREELIESAEEAERILSLPKEEQEKYFTSWDEFKQELEEKYDIKDTRTEEEKQGAMIRLHRDSIFNCIQKQISIKKFRDSGH